MRTTCARQKVGSSIGARVFAPSMWLLDPLARPKDLSDMAAFARAEIEFDIGQRLGEIITPTLVVAGDRGKGFRGLVWPAQQWVDLQDQAY